MFQMVSLCKDPKGEMVLGDSTTPDQKLSNLQGNNSETATTTTQQDELAVLRERVAELEEKLKQSTNWRLKHNSIKL